MEANGAVRGVLGHDDAKAEVFVGLQRAEPAALLGLLQKTQVDVSWNKAL